MKRSHFLYLYAIKVEEDRSSSRLLSLGVTVMGISSKLWIAGSVILAGLYFFSRHFHPTEHGVSILPAPNPSPEQPQLLNFEQAGQRFRQFLVSGPSLSSQQFRL